MEKIERSGECTNSTKLGLQAVVYRELSEKLRRERPLILGPRYFESSNTGLLVRPDMTHARCTHEVGALDQARDPRNTS